MPLDIGAVAAGAILARENASAGPTEVITLSGPEALTGEGNAAIWSHLLGKPTWAAMDMRLMLDRFETDGKAASAAEVQRLTMLLGRNLRTYRGFAEEAASQWQKG